jgi:hypothetical protein
MLKSQVDWAINYIDYMRSRTEERVRQSIRARSRKPMPLRPSVSHPIPPPER